MSSFWEPDCTHCLCKCLMFCFFFLAYVALLLPTLWHETVCVFKPIGKGKRLPEVHCVVSKLGCFNLFAKVRQLYSASALLIILSNPWVCFSKKGIICMHLSHTHFPVGRVKVTNSKWECGQEENFIYMQSCILALFYCLHFNQHKFCQDTVIFGISVRPDFGGGGEAQGDFPSAGLSFYA